MFLCAVVLLCIISGCWPEHILHIHKTSFYDPVPASQRRLEPFTRQTPKTFWIMRETLETTSETSSKVSGIFTSSHANLKIYIEAPEKCFGAPELILLDFQHLLYDHWNPPRNQRNLFTMYLWRQKKPCKTCPNLPEICLLDLLMDAWTTSAASEELFKEPIKTPATSSGTAYTAFNDTWTLLSDSWEPPPSPKTQGTTSKTPQRFLNLLEDSLKLSKWCLEFVRGSVQFFLKTL